jgi:hypothetical protein
MYVSKDDLNFDIYYQGDVVKNFPFFIFDNFEFVEKSGEKLYKKSEDKKTEEESFIIAKAKLSNIIILSHTCDIQQRENVIIAPIYPIKLFEENGILTNGKSGLIKKRKIAYWFYLPKLEGIIEDSLVDFQTIIYVSVKFLDNFRNNKVLTMTDWGRHHLGWGLSNYFGRPIEDKDK